MFAVGMLGSYLTQGVYAVAGPFQPFGGAVDIIVVQQEDGSFKSSPWYVKFGDFQGSLRSQEKIVNISVNDNPADFHMFLDNKGEAYFEKEVELEVPTPSQESSSDELKDIASSEVLTDEGSSKTSVQEISNSNNEGSFSQNSAVSNNIQSVQLEDTRIEEIINVSDESITAYASDSTLDKTDDCDLSLHTETKATYIQRDSIAMSSAQISTSHSLILLEKSDHRNEVDKNLDDTPEKSIHSNVDASPIQEKNESHDYGIYGELNEEVISSRSSSTLSLNELQSQNEQCDGEQHYTNIDNTKIKSEDNTVWWNMETQNTVEEPNICAACNDVSCINTASDETKITTHGATGEGVETFTCTDPVVHDLKNGQVHQLCTGNAENGSCMSEFLESEGSRDVIITISENSSYLAEGNLGEDMNDDGKSKDTVEDSSVADIAENPLAQTAAAASSSSSKWRLWPLSFRRSRIERESLSASTDASLQSQDSTSGGFENEDSLQKNLYYKWPQKTKVRTYVPTSAQLGSLNLGDGPNKVTFTFSRAGGKTEVDARIYLWKWNTRIVISDVDGTITKSDVLGQVMPLVGRDWSQYGVTRLFSAIKDNGFEVLFLSARAISQAYLTRRFLLNLKQDGEALPEGPVFISPDGLIPSLYREVIRRAPHEFKISCLEGIRELFPKDVNPFYAGFGNRITDEISYVKVGIPKGKIFIINPKGEVVVNRSIDCKSYTSLHALVDDMFPPMSSQEQEDFNSWNYWKMPLPDIEEELNTKGSKTTKKTKK